MAEEERARNQREREKETQQSTVTPRFLFWVSFTKMRRLQEEHIWETESLFYHIGNLGASRIMNSYLTLWFEFSKEIRIGNRNIPSISIWKEFLKGDSVKSPQRKHRYNKFFKDVQGLALGLFQQRIKEEPAKCSECSKT